MKTKPSGRKTKPSASPVKRNAATLATSRKLPTRRRIKAAPPAASASKGSVARVHDSKQAQLIARLRILPGATISQLMALTGWQTHTVRGAISGVLRKRMGLNVLSANKDGSGERLYCIAKARAAK